jgi:hypothetical protein
MADELDRLALDRMVQALRPQVPLPTPRPAQVPLPRPDPRGNDFTDRIAGQISLLMPHDQIATHPDVVMQKNGYATTADNKSVEPQAIMDNWFNTQNGYNLPQSYGAGRNKLYTPTMTAPPAQDVIANWLKNNPT